MTSLELTLEDLSNISGLPLRTLRFYMQEGILQSPDTHGKYSRYSQQHLDRLELIRRLKNLRIPISEIRQLIENMSPEEYTQIREYQDLVKERLKGSQQSSYVYSNTPQQPLSSAMEYIQNLELGRNTFSNKANPPAAAPAPSPVSSPAISRGKDSKTESWTRVILAEGIELNIRTPQNQEERRKIDRLIEFANQIFKH